MLMFCLLPVLSILLIVRGGEGEAMLDYIQKIQQKEQDSYASNISAICSSYTKLHADMLKRPEHEQKIIVAYPHRSGTLTIRLHMFVPSNINTLILLTYFLSFYL